jgi:hypothetical protein
MFEFRRICLEDFIPDSCNVSSNPNPYRGPDAAQCGGIKHECGGALPGRGPAELLVCQHE